MKKTKSSISSKLTGLVVMAALVVVGCEAQKVRTDRRAKWVHRAK
jgi:hypothetical protein